MVSHDNNRGNQPEIGRKNPKVGMGKVWRY